MEGLGMVEGRGDGEVGVWMVRGGGPVVVVEG